MNLLLASTAHPRSLPDYGQMGEQLHALLGEHHLWTALCGLLVICMIVSAYKLLRSISPVLVPVALFLVALITLLTWTQTRTEPKILSPVVDVVAHLVPRPTHW